MTPLLLLALAVTPWNIAESPPRHLELFATKPVPDKNVFGKVSPALASVAAFSKSAHPFLDSLSVEQRAAFTRLVELSVAKKPEQVSFAFAKSRQEPELPVAFIELADVTLSPATKSVERRLMTSGDCASDGESCTPEDIGLSIEQPVRVVRDEQKRIRALAFRTERHVTQDNHSGKKVTAKNAREHEFSSELLEFDETGRLIRSVKWSRSDNDMRYLPGIDVQAWTYEWKDGALVQATGILVTEDSDALDLLVREKKFAAPPKPK